MPWGLLQQQVCSALLAKRIMSEERIQKNMHLIIVKTACVLPFYLAVTGAGCMRPHRVHRVWAGLGATAIQHMGSSMAFGLLTD